MMKSEKAKIKKWIFDNHDHHENADDGMEFEGCVDKDSPYVNSLELEKFIDSL